MDPGIRGNQLRGREGRPGEGRKGFGKAVLIGGGAVLLALGAASQLSGPWFSPAIDMRSDEPNRARGPVTIEADALQAAYQDDPDAAAGLFDGREMVVSGEFLRIVPDGYGSLDLRLKTSNPDEQLGVDVADLAIEDARQLTPGQRVTVSCQGMGQGGDELWVRDCAIQFGDDAAPPSPEAPPPPEAPDQGPEGA
jgi:hypothetical protein